MSAVSIRLPRGTKASLDAIAAANGLVVGATCYLTDEQRIAVATGMNSYALFAKTDEAGGADAVLLTGDQTIAGTKTFSAAIAGSVTGTAANVTGTVALANGGTGATAAADARTNLGLGTAALRNMHAGTTAPSNPSIGDLWVDMN
jgi:hypothetical protein